MVSEVSKARSPLPLANRRESRELFANGVLIPAWSDPLYPTFVASRQFFTNSGNVQSAQSAFE